MIREGEWRSAGDRADPQKTIEQKGLNSGEVVMMAESIGQAEVVPSSDFAKTLRGGRPVLVGVRLPNGGDHEVVLTNTFQHGAETWYAMMDFYQGPLRRLYLSNKELNIILLQNSVAFRPEPGATPKLLH